MEHPQSKNIGKLHRANTIPESALKNWEYRIYTTKIIEFVEVSASERVEYEQNIHAQPRGVMARRQQDCVY